MRLPEEVKIGSHPYVIIERKRLRGGDGKPCAGLCSTEQLLILVEKKLRYAPTQQLAVFLHEVIHAIEDARGLTLPEETVQALADGLAGFLLDNDMLTWERGT